MRPYPMIVCLLTAILLGGTFPAVGEEKPLPPPRHRVAAMYFHRTHRCPTCRRISAYIEEAIKTGFAEELPKRQVSLHLVDFQNAKNAKYTKAYKITGPTLVLANVQDGRVTAWKPMPKVWSLVAKKAEFFKYVQQGVHDYLGDQ